MRLCVPLAECGSSGTAERPHSGLPDFSHKDFQEDGRWGAGSGVVGGWWLPQSSLPTFQRQFSRELPLHSWPHAGAEPGLICSMRDSGKTSERTSCLERVRGSLGAGRDGASSREGSWEGTDLLCPWAGSGTPPAGRGQCVSLVLQPNSLSQGGRGPFLGQECPVSLVPALSARIRCSVDNC